MFYNPDQNLNLVGILGSPVSHSKSPAMHNEWIKKAGLNAFYTPLLPNLDDLEEILQVMPKMGFIGCNVTVPFKEACFELVMEHGTVSESARLIGAINTIGFAKGKLHGFNTDVYGFGRTIEEANLKPKSKVLVIGAGGAGKAVLYALKNSAESNFEIDLYNRTFTKAEALAKQFGVRNVLTYDIANYDAIVNTTSVGLQKGECIISEEDSSLLHKNQTLVDIIYGNTEFLERGQSAGCKCIDGQIMLVEQAKKSFEIWFDVMPT